MTFFSHRPVFFAFLYIFLLNKQVTPIFLHQKLLFHNPNFLLQTVFSQFELCLTSNNNNSQNIRGTDTWALPPQIFFGGTVTVPLSRSPPVSASDKLVSLKWIL